MWMYRNSLQCNNLLACYFIITLWLALIKMVNDSLYANSARKYLQYIYNRMVVPVDQNLGDFMNCNHRLSMLYGLGGICASARVHLTVPSVVAILPYPNFLPYTSYSILEMLIFTSEQYVSSPNHVGAQNTDGDSGA